MKTMYNTPFNSIYQSKWYYLKDDILCGASKEAFLKRINDGMELLAALRETIEHGGEGGGELGATVRGVVMAPREDLE